MAKQLTMPGKILVNNRNFRRSVRLLLGRSSLSDLALQILDAPESTFRDVSVSLNLLLLTRGGSEV